MLFDYLHLYSFLPDWSLCCPATVPALPIASQESLSNTAWVQKLNRTIFRRAVKSYYTKYTKTYEWIEPLSPDEQSIIEDMIVIEYSTPYITTIQMNWGWDSSNNSETFSISGDWETIVNGQTRNYIYEREMFYGYY